MPRKGKQMDDNTQNTDPNVDSNEGKPTAERSDKMTIDEGAPSNTVDVSDWSMIPPINTPHKPRADEAFTRKDDNNDDKAAV